MSAELEALLQDNAVRPYRSVDGTAIRTAVVRRRMRRAKVRVAAMALAVFTLANLVSLPSVRPVPTILSPDPSIEREVQTPSVDPEAPDDGAVTILGTAAGPSTGPVSGGTGGPIQSPPGTFSAEAAGSDGRGPGQTPSPPASADLVRLAAWTFDEGFDGWRDERGFDEFGGMVAGQAVSTQEQDPRQGWQPWEAGRADTAGVRGRRMNGVVRGRFSAPLVSLPQDVTGLSIQLWYRWDVRAGDVDLSLWDGDREVVIGALVPGRDTEGWTRFSTTVVVDNGQGAPEWIALRLDSYFEEPAVDCTSEQARSSVDCDMGFTVDDVTVSYW